MSLNLCYRTHVINCTDRTVHSNRPDMFMFDKTIKEAHLLD